MKLLGQEKFLSWRREGGSCCARYVVKTSRYMKPVESFERVESLKKQAEFAQPAHVIISRLVANN